MHKLRVLYLLPCLLLIAPFCRAQSAVLNLPMPSQQAVVTQRIGITDITINYHRPLVKGRKIWGGLVPYGEVWRAGANVNTTISFTDPVTIEGKPIGAGTYGLHMIPTQDQWTIIFSNANTSWGSFSYKQSEDALRVTVKPQPVDFHEALAYDFDDLTPDSAVATLRWEKLAVPFKVSVDVNKVVEASLQKQLRGLAQYTWDGWNDAADYLVSNKVDLDEALRDTGRSIQVEERYENLMTKSQALDALGRKDEATKFRNDALAKANALQLYGYAFQIQSEGRQEEAVAVFRSNAKKFPDSWISHVGMGRVYSAQGDFDNAVKEMQLALAGAPSGAKSFVQGQIAQLQAKVDINKM